MEIIAIIEQQSPFVQGLIASAVFGFSIWFVRAIFRMISKSSSVFFKQYQRDLLAKHWLHRHYVNSNDQYRFSLGFNVVVLQSIRWMIRGVLIFLFFFAVESILESNWLSVACAWLVFNCFLEAGQWAKDSSSEREIEKFDNDIKKEFFDSLPEIHKEHAKYLDNNS
jgi:hypothetical protein